MIKITLMPVKDKNTEYKLDEILKSADAAGKITRSLSPTIHEEKELLKELNNKKIVQLKIDGDTVFITKELIKKRR